MMKVIDKPMTIQEHLDHIHDELEKSYDDYINLCLDRQLVMKAKFSARETSDYIRVDRTTFIVKDENKTDCPTNDIFLDEIIKGDTRQGYTIRVRVKDQYLIARGETQWAAFTNLAEQLETINK